VSFNDEYWLWTQDTSSRFNAITLIHGGLGHRPLIFEKSIHCKSDLGFIELYLSVSLFLIWEGTWVGSFDHFLILATISAEKHSVFVILPMPTYLSHLPSLNPCMLKITSSNLRSFTGNLGQILPASGRKILVYRLKRALGQKNPVPLLAQLFSPYGSWALILFPHPSQPNRSPPPLLHEAPPSAAILECSGRRSPLPGRPSLRRPSVSPWILVFSSFPLSLGFPSSLGRIFDLLSIYGCSG
jgi:hypothetical protein